MLFIELLEFFIYSGQKSFIREVFCKYFHPVSSLYFNFPYKAFQRPELFNFYEIPFINSLWFVHFMCPK